MPRQRMVKAEFFNSESLAECSHTARLAFIGLWVMADDNGNMKAQPRRLRTQIFPFDDMTDDAFVSALCELEAVGCIKGYESDGQRYITIANFLLYQTIRKPSKTNIPLPDKNTASAAGTSLVRHWYGTSDAQVQTKCSTSEDQEVSYMESYSAAPVQTNGGTSDALKKQAKEVVIPSYKGITTTPFVATDADADALSGAPHRAATEHVGERGKWVCGTCGSKVYPNGFGWSCPRHKTIGPDAAVWEPEHVGCECPQAVLDAIRANREAAS